MGNGEKGEKDKEERKEITQVPRVQSEDHPLRKNNLLREERLFFFFLSLVETLKHDCDFY